MLRLPSSRHPLAAPHLWLLLLLSSCPTTKGGLVNRSPDDESSTPVAAIVGGVLGSVAGVVLFLVLIYVFREPKRPPAAHPPRMYPRRRATDAACSVDESPRTSGIADAAYPPVFSTPLSANISSQRVGPTVSSLPMSSLPASPIVLGDEPQGAAENAQAHRDVAAMLPGGSPPSGYPPAPSSPTGGPADNPLHNQVAALQEEVARLRQVELEMQNLLVPPPRYDEIEDRSR